MTLKKPPSNKRAVLPRRSDRDKSFVKDWVRLSRSGRYDLNRLKEVMALLVSNEPLGPEWRGHALAGPWTDHRECHVGGDFLLIYRLTGSAADETVVFVRAGTHAELFE